MNKFTFFYVPSELSTHEVELYAALAPEIDFIDVTGPRFKPFKDKVSQDEAKKTRVVLTESGDLIEGFDALLATWERIPKMKFLIPIVTGFTVKPFALAAFAVYKKNI